MRSLFLYLSVFLCTNLYAIHPLVEDCDFTLSIDRNQARIVTEIVTTLGSQNLVALGLKRKHLSGLGQQLKGLGVFHFLGYILTEPKLRKHMSAIKKSNFKWNGFVSGIIPSLKIEAEKQAFTQNVQAFAKYLQIPSHGLEAKARSRDWDAFVAELVKLCCNAKA